MGICLGTLICFGNQRNFFINLQICTVAVVNEPSVDVPPLGGAFRRVRVTTDEEFSTWHILFDKFFVLFVFDFPRFGIEFFS